MTEQRNALRSGLTESRKLRVSPQQTSAQLVHLLHTPLGQSPSLSELLPAWKIKSSPQYRAEQDAAVRELVTANQPAKTKSNRRPEANRTDAPAQEASLPQPAQEESSWAPAVGKLKDLALSLDAYSFQPQQPVPEETSGEPSPEPSQTDAAWLREVLRQHAQALEVAVPQLPAPEQGPLARTGQGSLSDDSTAIQRRALVLHFPLSAHSHAGTLPFEVTDWQGKDGLLVLPALKPSSRRDAQMLQGMLEQLAAEPAVAASMAAQWRQKRLEECCAAALGCLASNTASWSLVLDPSRDVPLLQPQQQTPASMHKSSAPPDNAASGETGTGASLAAGGADAREGHHAGVRLGGYSAWCMGGFLLALTAAMADAVQQTEVQCTERGRALVAIWNMYTAVTNASVGTLQENNARLEEQHAAMAAEVLQLQSTLASTTRLCSLLQRDAARRNKATDKAMRELEGATPVHVRLKACQWQLDCAAEYASSRLQALRWQHAAVAAVTPRYVPRMPAFRKLADPESSILKAMVNIEDLAAAAAALQMKRKIQSGQAAGEAAPTTRLKQWSLGKLMAADPKAAFEMLELLTPEARALALSSLGSEECAQLLVQLPEDELAAVLACLTDARRRQIMQELTELDAHLAECAYDTMRYTPELASQWLPSIAQQQGREELRAYDPALRHHVLLALQPRDTAVLLEGLRQELQTEILKDLPAGTAGLAVSCMTRGLAVEALLQLGNPSALACLLGMPGADAIRLLQHLSDDDAQALAKDLSSEQLEALTQLLSPATAERLCARLSKAAEPVSTTEEDVAERPASPIVELGGIARTGSGMVVPAPLTDDRLEAIKAAAAKAAGKGAPPKKKGKKSVGAKSPREDPEAPDGSGLAAAIGAIPKPESAHLLRALPASVLQQAADALSALAAAAGETSIPTTPVPKPTADSTAPSTADNSRAATPSAAPAVKQWEASPMESSAGRAVPAKAPAGVQKLQLEMLEDAAAPEAAPPAEELPAGKDEPAAAPDAMGQNPASALPEGMLEDVEPIVLAPPRARKSSSLTGSWRRLSLGVTDTSSGTAAKPPAPARRASRPSRDSKDVGDAELSMPDQASIVAVGPPRDRRLSAALAVHSTAKVRTLGWAVSVIEGVYADFETLAARIGGLHLVAVQRVDEQAVSPTGRITIPDVTFSYLHNKYGSRALVDEYVGSLVNTLSAWQLADTRLAIFARLLTEDWLVPVAAAFLTARTILNRPAYQVTCIEYPPLAGKPSPWLCLAKAGAAADAALGVRSEAVRQAFVEHLSSSSVPATKEDLQYLNTGNRAGATTDESAFLKLSRDAFLLSLCEESSRIETALAAAVPLLFSRIAAHAPTHIPGVDSSFDQDLEQLPSGDDSEPGRPVAVPSFALQGWAQGELMAESSSMTAEELAGLLSRFEAQAVGEAEEHEPKVTLQGFTSVAETSLGIRSYLLLRHVPVARYNLAEAADSALTQQDRQVLKHLEAMLPTWRQLIAGAPDAWHARLSSLVERVGSQRPGVRQLQLYAALLQALAALGIQGLMNPNEPLLQAPEAIAGDADSSDRQLSRVEQAIVMLHGGGPVRQEMQIVSSVHDLVQSGSS